MSHSLNEQVLQIPSGTAATNIELILDGIATAIGGYRHEYGVYFDSNYTAGALFHYTEGNDSCRVDYIGNNVIISYTSSFNLTTARNFYYHISSDEKTKYLQLGSDNSFCFIYALDENDKYAFYSPASYSYNIYGIGEGVSTTNNLLYLPNNTAPSYSIAKMADIFHNTIAKSLYMLVGTASNASFRNNLVKFGDVVYRIVFVGGSTSSLPLAFPVSDPVTP